MTRFRQCRQPQHDKTATRQHTPKSPLKRGVLLTPLLRGDLGVCAFCRLALYLLFLLLLLTACQFPKELIAPAEPTATPTASPTPLLNEAFDVPKFTQQQPSLRWRTNPNNETEIALNRSINRIANQEIEGLHVSYEPGGDQKADYYGQLKLEIANGTAPDVFWLSGTDLADFAARGMILDLHAFAEADPDYVAENFYAGPMQHLTYDPKTSQTGQRLWGLPRDVSTFVLYLNLDLIEQGLMPDPRQLAKEGKWDWHAFLQVADAVNHLGDNIYGYGQNAWWATYGYWIQAAGGDFYYPDRSACLLDSEKALYGLDFQRAMYQDSKVAVPYHEDAAAHFLVGTLGMYLDGRGAANVVEASVHFNWDIVKLPDSPEGPSHWLLWGAYVVSRNTEHPQAAYELVRTLTRSDMQLKMSELEPKIPSRVNNHVTGHFLTLNPPKNNGAYLQALTDNPQTMGPLWNGSWFHYLAIMDHLLSRVLTGELTLEDYASAICNEANSAFFK